MINNLIINKYLIMSNSSSHSYHNHFYCFYTGNEYSKEIFIYLNYIIFNTLFSNIVE